MNRVTYSTTEGSSHAISAPISSQNVFTAIRQTGIPVKSLAAGSPQKCFNKGKSRRAPWEELSQGPPLPDLTLPLAASSLQKGLWSSEAARTMNAGCVARQRHKKRAMV